MLDAQVLSVQQLNRKVSNLLETQLAPIWVRGEISNFYEAGSGHWYFTLKDAHAAVKAVMFRGRTASLGFVPKAGEAVDLFAQVTLYEARGDYQLQVEAMRRAGQGHLHEAFLLLKDKLEQMGLFDPVRKLPIVAMPTRIGVITSLGAAALRDVLTTLKRRLPHVEVILYPSPVQGAAATESLCQALRTAVARNEVDTLLLVRGGGSLEDLWCFNEESLATHIAYCPIPVITGVGHETDFTIADFAADLRAPTPTAAAELAGTDRRLLVDALQQQSVQLQRATIRQLERRAIHVDGLAARLQSPQQRLAAQSRHLHSTMQRLLQAEKHGRLSSKRQLQHCVQRLHKQLPQPALAQPQLRGLEHRLQQAWQHRLQQHQQQVQAAHQALHALSPSHVLERGYAIVRGEAGQIVKNALDLKLSESLRIQLGQGEAHASVTEVSAHLSHHSKH